MTFPQFNSNSIYSFLFNSRRASREEAEAVIDAQEEEAREMRRSQEMDRQSEIQTRRGARGNVRTSVS
jgi:hypothetical protein